MKIAILCLLYALGLPDGHAPGTLGAQHFECAKDTTGDGLPDIDAPGAPAFDLAAYNAQFDGMPVTPAIHDPE